MSGEGSELRVDSRPQLRRPVLIASFRGWNDGGQGASLAGAFLAKAWDSERFAEIDPEEFFDFSATRPHVSLVEGTVRRIDWPENSFHAVRLEGAPRDAILLLGSEPSLRWRTFTSLVTGLATELGVDMAVTLDCRQSLADGRFRGAMGDHDHGGGRARVLALQPGEARAGAPLHNALERDAMLGHAGGDGGKRAGAVIDRQPDVVAAFVSGDLRLLVRLQVFGLDGEGRYDVTARDINQVGYDR